MYQWFSVQIEDLSQQAQVAAAEKFKEPPVIPATEAGGSTTVRYIFVVTRCFFGNAILMYSII